MTILREEEKSELRVQSLHQIKLRSGIIPVTVTEPRAEADSDLAQVLGVILIAAIIRKEVGAHNLTTGDPHTVISTAEHSINITVPPIRGTMKFQDR